MKKIFPVLLIALLIITNIATYNYALNMNPRAVNTDPDLGKNIEGSSDEEALAFFHEVWDRINSDYLTKPPARELAEGAVQGMLETLGDPQTYFLSDNDMEDMMIETYGSFSGIGVEISEINEEVVVITVFPDTPAEEAGLKPGDMIVSVDGEVLSGEDLINTAGNKIRGGSGTNVSLEIHRPGEEETFTKDVTRRDVELLSVNSQMIKDGIGYIQITSFDGGTGTDFNDHLKQLNNETTLEGLVLDLRGNPGGLLTEAINVGEILVTEGEITRVVDKEGNVIKRYLSQAEPLGYPIVVLVDEGSASAAEIIAGALQDRDIAVLVGQTTYGKATVQEISWLDNGGGLRYTIAKYQTPSGKDIHKVGITPDYVVEQDEGFYMTQHSIIPGIGKDYQFSDALLQLSLQELGYQLEVTGEFNHETKTALEQFQAASGLNPSGWVDQPTADKINRDLSERGLELDKQMQKALDVLSSEIN